MTGTGLWKNWNTQEYLEELIRLTFPAAKVNNVVPFTKYIGSGTRNAIVAQENILYFTQVQFFGGFPETALLQVGLLDKVSLLNYDADFIMYQDLSVNGISGTAILTGYKITLDNNIKNIQDSEEPPVIANISGRVKNDIWFTSFQTTWNTTLNYAIYVGCSVDGTTDAVGITSP